MGTIRLGTFPSTSNKIFQDDIAKRVLEWFISRFSPGFFNHIFLNTQSSAASSYIINEQTGELQKTAPGQKILQPALRMNVNQGKNNMDEVFGNFWNPNQQPGAFMIDTDLTGYKPFFYDPYGVILCSNDYTIRNNFDIRISLQTKADQLSMFNYCDSNLKHMYVQVIPVETKILLPNLMMEYIKKSVFKYEMDMLDKMVGDSEDKRNYRNRINDRFTEYLYDFSNKAIKPFREQDTETGVTNYIYSLARTQYITFRIERPDGDEGTKKGGAYTGFEVTTSGWMEYANPISFITNVPAIIRGRKNDHYIRLSSTKDYKNRSNIMTFKEVFKDDRKRLTVDKRWNLFYTEYEIMMSVKEEKFNILDEVIDPNDTPSAYYIISALLDTIKTKEEFNRLFDIDIYKHNEPLSKDKYEVDENFTITVHDCDLMVPYYIDVFINKEIYQTKIEYILTKLYNAGIILDKTGTTFKDIINMGKGNVYKILFQYITHTKKSKFGTGTYRYNPITKQYYLDDKTSNNGSDGTSTKDDDSFTVTLDGVDENGSRFYYDKTFFLTVGSEYFWKFAHRRGWHYLVKSLENDTFVPIKIQDFCIASPDYQYYTKSVDGDFIPVQAEVVEVRDDLQFYFKDKNDFFAINREEVLKPDPEYQFYIFNRETKKFMLCVNLNKFDKDEQYYILKDQHRTNEVLAKEYK